FVNGGYTGITAATYSSSTLANNDVITVKMFFVGACGNDSANSLPFTVSRAASVPAGVSIALTSGTNPGCPNQTLTFTATPVNGGAAPTYTWKVNNATVGTNSNAYSATFGNNDVVTVFLKSNSTCASPDTITASPITIQYLYNMQQIAVALTNGQNPTCSGKPLTFTATVTNGGTNINYQWLVNSATIPGATNATFTSATLTNNAVVQVASTVTDPCVLNLSDTSTPITVYVIPSDTPNVQIAITKGSNPGCLDSLIEFKAMVTKHGAAPNLTWFVNGLNVAAGSIFSSNTLLNGDIVTLRSAATDTLCYTADTAFSAPLVMIRNSTPPAPVISFIGNMLVSNVTTKLQWFGPAGKIPGATSSTYHPTQAGSYYAVQDNNGCYSAPSNILTVSLLDIATYDLSQVKIYPNPTTGLVNLDWGTKNTTVRIDIFSAAGQGLYYDELHNGSHKILNLSNFASGNYFIVIRDEAGNIGTQKITLTK
ncbi:MAG: T9SS type A sorting domain-containing protein, partial [Bacteroidetes bacterium]|nr:T9SS type A sorting domain-containing protein [Bacteroidota bacterium]